MRIYQLLFGLLLLVSCDSTALFEENYEFPGGNWKKEDVREFEFDIVDRNQEYNLYFNVRNTLSYPNHNLYIRYKLFDKDQNEVVSELVNYNLFDPKSGKPFGSGLGDIFDHQFPLLSSYKFPVPGHYKMSLIHYMRTDTLNDILSVGLRIESNSTSSD